jgi:glutamyl-tRNA synthetase
MFSMEQFVEWFDLGHISRSPAKFNPEKLLWLSQQYLKAADDSRLATLVTPFLARDGCDTASGPDLLRVVALLKERVNTVEELADAAVYFYRAMHPTDELRSQHYAAGLGAMVDSLVARLGTIAWDKPAISEAIKATVTEFGLKMPKLAMPLRVMVTGEAQTPAIDAVLELLGRDTTLARIAAERPHLP